MIHYAEIAMTLLMHVDLRCIALVIAPLSALSGRVSASWNRRSAHWCNVTYHPVVKYAEVRKH